MPLRHPGNFRAERLQTPTTTKSIIAEALGAFWYGHDCARVIISGRGIDWIRVVRGFACRERPNRRLSFGCIRRSDRTFLDAIAGRVDGEGQEVEGGEGHVEMLFAVTEIVFEIITIILQDFEGFVLDYPPCSSAGGDIGDVLCRDLERGDPKRRRKLAGPWRREWSGRSS